MDAGRKVRFDSDVSRETRDTLRTYSDLILRWTGKINLIARSDATEDSIHNRHIADSLQLLPLIPDGVTRATDLGSGAGFPGMVIAIARPDIHVTMIESDHRKAAFLQTVVASLGLQATVLASRIEAALTEPADLVTARALAPLPALLDHAVRMLAPGGICLFPKGRDVQPEIDEAAETWCMVLERIPSQTALDATILRISELRRAS